MDWHNNLRLRRAARKMAAGEVIGYPTEAVWGLGCDPLNPVAVHRLLDLKQRPVEKGLILVAANMAQLEPYWAELSPAQRQQLEASWPGPLTWLVPASDSVPPWIRGQFTSVALRVSAHPVVRALCLAFGRPVVSTSANPAGLPAAKTALAVRRYFKDQLGDMTPGTVGSRQKPSEIRDLLTGKVIRGA